MENPPSRLRHHTTCCLINPSYTTLHTHHQLLLTHQNLSLDPQSLRLKRHQPLLILLRPRLVIPHLKHQSLPIVLSWRPRSPINLSGIRRLPILLQSSESTLVHLLRKHRWRSHLLLSLRLPRSKSTCSTRHDRAPHQMSVLRRGHAAPRFPSGLRNSIAVSRRRKSFSTRALSVILKPHERRAPLLRALRRPPPKLRPMATLL